jgi:membrane associated rhomboid family serine protease
MIPLRDDNPSYRFPLVTLLLIAVNSIVFVFSILGGDSHYVKIIYTYGMIPASLLHGQIVTSLPDELLKLGVPNVDIHPVAPILTLFTMMFLHGGWAHLIGNMWFLWLFGDNVEDRMGHFRFLIFYLLTGLIASLAHAFVANGSIEPAIGASGAISGVIGAYIILFPSSNILTLWFFFFIPQVVNIPAMVYLGFWFIIQVWSGFAGLGGTNGAGVAFFAHIGGFLAGVILFGLFTRRQLVQIPRENGRWSKYDKNSGYHDVWY